MAIRNILRDGDELLLKKSKEVTRFDSRLHTLLDDMWDTMKNASGAGLAAPQVGVLRRIFIVDDGEEKFECINPVIVSEEGEREIIEGCLSVPDVHGYVRRPVKVTVRAQDRDGKEFEITREELLGQGICHEFDHLNGILFTTKIVRYYNENEDGE